ncbi:MAG TPA: oligopeptide:H+ symporter, partial [Actinoplanes sp.]|nr:oligopeptide:H+ symporter [Actinoplanes sp.]
YGFGLAAVGMAIGLTQYALTRKNLPANANKVANPLPAGRRPLVFGLAALVVALIAVLARTGVIRADWLSDIVVTLSILAAVAYFVVILSSHRITVVERRRVLAFIPMFIASAAFWSLYQQQFTVITIYSDKRLDRDLGGWEFPVSWVQSINPVFIIILAGAFAAMWTRLGDRQPSTPVKFALGTAIMGVAYLLFIPFAGTARVPLVGLAGILLVFTLAELLLSPVGLSLTTKLAPEAFRTQMVALFFLSVALGTALSGTLAGYYREDREVPYFGILGVVAIVLGGILFALTPMLKRLMGGVR